MQPLHQLLFWFVIKNIIPRAQGKNQDDAMGCGFTLLKAGDRRIDQGAQTPSVPAPDRGGDQGVQTPSVPAPAIATVPSPSQPQSAAPTSASDQGLRADLSALQRELKEEKELNAKRHADLLALLQTLQPKPPAP